MRCLGILIGTVVLAARPEVQAVASPLLVVVEWKRRRSSSSHRSDRPIATGSDVVDNAAGGTTIAADLRAELL